MLNTLHSRRADDLITALIAAAWAVFNLAGRSFALAPSMRAASHAFGARGDAELIFGSCLLAGAALQAFGWARGWRAARIAGAIVGFGVFAAAGISSAATLAFDPATPAYLGLALIYFCQAALVVTGER